MKSHANQAAIDVVRWYDSRTLNASMLERLLIALFRILTLLVVGFLSSEPLAQETAYNELYDESGTLRPAYQQFFSSQGVNPLEPTEQAIEFLSGTPLDDPNYQIFHIPLILDSLEAFDQIQLGVQQRADVLHAFFADIAVGQARALEEDIVPMEVFQLILQGLDRELKLEHIREMYAGKTAADISFFYGPDIMRLPDGRWVVIEDNVGNLGGVGTTEAIAEA
ncbi:MAG: circularly permuted type 2 ATP-grasp protein, partial [Pseudomonadota bacterium]